MIKYPTGRRSLIQRAFQCWGSVFPFAFCVALPPAILTALVKYLADQDQIPEKLSNVLNDTAGWSGFVFLVGFLSVFRTSQAYARFWEGVSAMHQMRAEWFDSFSCLVAFSRHPGAGEAKGREFQQILVRLYSMLHAVALAEIEERNGGKVQAFSYELLDAAGLDRESIRTLKFSEAKVELVFQWIQQLVVDNLTSQVLNVPAPILSRAFQELANGMAKFHEALKISAVPFPFPYTQTCEVLLIMHWACTPVVVAQWVSSPWWGALFGFLQVFVYWSLNTIALEIEQPFGIDANDLDSKEMQVEFNGHLLLLLDTRTKRTPTLSPELLEQSPYDSAEIKRHHSSLEELWVSEPPLSSPGSDRPAEADSGRSLKSAGTNSSKASLVSLPRGPPEVSLPVPQETSGRAQPSATPIGTPAEVTGGRDSLAVPSGGDRLSTPRTTPHARPLVNDPGHTAAPPVASQADPKAQRDTGRSAVQLPAAVGALPTSDISV